MNAFDVLNDLNINGHTESKNVGGKELTYLSWPWAWAEVKKRYPDAHYEIWRNADGLPYSVDPMTGFMVFTSVTIEGITHDMWLPVMNGANKAMKPTAYKYKVGSYEKECEAATMTDINKTIMRCLVKNLAMFGLGLYIYAGEDLPEAEKENEPPKQEKENEPPKQEKQENPKTTGKEFSPPKASTGTVQKVPEIPPVKEENPVKKYVANELTFMKQMFGIPSTDEMMKKFAKMRKSLIEAKIIEDVDSDRQTMEQAEAMIDAIYKNFTPTGDQVKVG